MINENKPVSLGERVELKGDDFERTPNGHWIELNQGNHSAAALVVWRMNDDESSPEREAFARRLVASYNACLPIELTALETHAYQTADKMIRELRDQVERLQDYERHWETMMNAAVGEDGPVSVVEAIDAIKLQRDTAWRELAAIRKTINANPEESTLDEVQRVVALGDDLLTSVEFITYQAGSRHFVGRHADADVTGVVGPVIAKIRKSKGECYYAPDGTLMNPNGTRSIFDDVDA